MKKMAAILLISALCAINVGCGVKGDLYFPAQSNQPTN
ncbi:hypothetical protein B0188_02175 [[Haemophilus] felis]|uniref:Lipoprotein n=1 Tax=[Haemophilus] felis TaxID=123822 RepID=A0A1T0B969_9PAST|nr:hypothetical protein B0188_02175 [[Haemophilus] felis]